MIKKCFCGKEFITYRSKLLLGKGKYCSKKCTLFITNKILEENGIKTRFVLGQKTHNFKGFTYTASRKNGKRYMLLYRPNHKLCTKKGYVREHRIKMEQRIGRMLFKDEVVHHIDENGLNNNIHNLQLLTKKQHDALCSKVK